MKVKKFLYKVMEQELEPIRNRRKEWENHIDDVYDILKSGTEKARQTAAQTLKEVRRAMKINYFENGKF